jgi:hypothetical protein
MQEWTRSVALIMHSSRRQQAWFQLAGGSPPELPTHGGLSLKPATQGSQLPPQGLTLAHSPLQRSTQLRLPLLAAARRLSRCLQLEHGGSSLLGQAHIVGSSRRQLALHASQLSLQEGLLLHEQPVLLKRHSQP